MRALALFPLLAVIIAGSALAGPSRTMQTAVPVEGATRVSFEYPVGELDVTGSPDSAVHLMLRATCKHPDDRCGDRIDALSLEAEHRSGTLRLKLLGADHWHNDMVKLRGTLQLPPSLVFALDMGVGEVHVGELTHDVSVKLGVGEVHVRLRQSDVRTVSIESGIGEANLIVGGHSMRGAGFLGRALHWDEGTGRAVVHVEVGVGQSSVIVD